MKDALDFTGRVVVVTGGSGGIGNGIACAFRDCGAEVIVTGTREADAYPESDLSNMRYHRLDAGDDDSVARFADTVERCDVLVNSLGMVVYKKQEYQIATFRRVIDVNLNGVMHLCLRFHDRLAARDGKAAGSIVNISSLSGQFSTRNNPAYSASKGGLDALTRTLAEAWGRDGIRVNGIAPGFVKTKMTEVSWANEGISENIERHTPLGRWGAPEDMAGAALFLASPLAAFMTGQTITVDGGLSLAIS